MRLELNYPPAILNPNANGHWRPKADAKKKYRRDCKFLASQFPGCHELKITFHPPDNRKRDRDNMIAAFKAGQDGLADAWGIDDSHFIVSYDVGEPVKHGRVIIEAGAG